jgi:taurine dioxygenase
MGAQTQAVELAHGNIEVQPTAFPLGAEVRCGDVRSLTDAARKQIKQAWLDNLVLLVRGQNLSPEELLRFAQTFGEIDKAAPDAEMPAGQKPRFHPNVSVVSNVVDNGVRLGSLGDGEVVWHTDHSYHEIPISASVLFALETPATGGRTGFLNMYRALETLPSDIRARIQGLRIKNDATYNSAGQIRRGLAPVTDLSQSPGVLHPAVRTHPETGYPALYLGRRPHAYVEGLPLAESERLLDFLWTHTKSQPAWYHQWKPGDVVVWDNRCVMHRREPFDPAARRIMHRAQCKGTRPYRDDRSPSTRHPRGAHESY